MQSAETVKSVSWSAIGSWGRQVLSLSIYTMLARLLEPEVFGIVALAAIFVAFAELFVSQGFGTALVQRKQLEKDHIDSAFWASTLISGLLAVLTVLLAGTIATIFSEPRLEPVLQVLSVLLVLVSLSSVPRALLTRTLDFRSLAIRSLGATGIGGLAGLVMALNGWGVWSLVAQQLVGASVGVLVLWWAVDWRPSFAISNRHLTDIYSFSLKVLGNDVLRFFSKKTDHTVIGYALGATMLGFYSLASRLIILLIEAVVVPLSGVALPTFCRLQESDDELKRAFYRFTEVAAAVSFPAFGGLAVLAPWLVPLVFGENWNGAIPILQILAIWGALWFAISFMNSLMLAKNRPGLSLILFVIDALGTVGACLIALKWGVQGVAAAVTLNRVLLVAIYLIFCRSLYGINLTRFLGKILLPGVATVVMVLLVGEIGASLSGRINDFALVSLLILFGVTIYAGVVLPLRRELARQAWNHVTVKVFNRSPALRS